MVETYHKTKDATVLRCSQVLYEDDGLLVAVVDERAPSGIVDPVEVWRAIEEGQEAGWHFYHRVDKHQVVYLIFFF